MAFLETSSGMSPMGVLLATPRVDLATEQELARKIRAGIDDLDFRILSALSPSRSILLRELVRTLGTPAKQVAGVVAALHGYVSLRTRQRKTWVKLTPKGQRLRAARRKISTAAAQQLIAANTRLVVHMAGAFARPTHSMEDLISEGFEGLTRAAYRFSPRGTAFCSYASHFIRQSFRNYVARIQHAASVPSHAFQKLGALYLADMDKESSVEDIMGVLHCTYKVAFPLQKLMQGALNLDAPMANQGDDPSAATLRDFVADTAPLQTETVLSEERVAELHDELGNLPQRDQEIIRARFGIGGKELTLEELGRKFRVTRERIRQVEFKVLRTLRARLLRRRRAEALAA